MHNPEISTVIPFKQEEMYLPIGYRPIDLPIFTGPGNHSVRQLEEICAQFAAYCHQQQIIKQNCMEIIIELRHAQIVQI
jgi:hypothetical protein